MDALLMVLMAFMAIFMMMLILIQRGKGGGLTGALGGMGGQSAFGTKAGDVFTRVTIVAATVWILLCIVAVKQHGGASDPLSNDLGRNAPAQRRGTGTAGEGADAGAEGAEGESSRSEGRTPARERSSRPASGSSDADE